MNERYTVREIQVLAPAKLNLFLEVLGRRDDGYHELETLMVAVDLYDAIVFQSREDRQLVLQGRWGYGLSGDADGPSASYVGRFPLTGENLIVRALELLRTESGCERGATIRLVKRIPSEAGLGGASSDAAAAMMAANGLWELNWPVARLRQLAARLGSDVPFFLSGAARAGAAICRGRGERIEPVPIRGRLQVVLVRPPEGLSTAEVYRGYRVAPSPEDVTAAAAALAGGDCIQLGRRLINRLEEPAAALSPWIGKLRRAFDDLPVLGHGMSGSGSSYFGICRTQRQARRLASRLRARGWLAVYCATSAAALPVMSRSISATAPTWGATPWRSLRFASN